MVKQNGAEIKEVENGWQTFTEDEILELFRSADDSSRQAALFILKCDKPQPGDVMSMLSGVMAGEESKGKKLLNALTALSIMMKNKSD